MARYNNSSIFRQIDLDDAASLRRLILCLYDEIDNGSISLEKCKKFELEKLEIVWVNRVLTAIRRNTRYPLLRQAIFRFVRDDYEKDKDILVAAKELENLTEEDVLLIPEKEPDRYQIATATFATLMAEERQVRNRGRDYVVILLLTFL